MIRIAFSTLGCPDWTFQEMVTQGVAAGFDGVEIRLVERETDLLSVPAFSAAQRAARRRELADAGFRVCSLASSVAFDSADSAERDRQVEIGRAYLDLAADLEADSIRVFGDIIREEVGRESLVEQVAEGLDRLGQYAATLGLSVVIETHGDFAGSKLARETLAKVSSPAAGILWDTHHPWRFFGESLQSSWSNLGPWVRHTHWKDSVTRAAVAADEEGGESAREAHTLMGGHRHADYVLFGAGEFPIIECLGLLAEAGYDGWYSYEWEKMWHPELESPEIALPLFAPKLRQWHSLVTR